MDDDQKAAKIAKLKEIVQVSQDGFVGMLPNGMLVDRRKHPEAMPVQENSFLNIGKSKPVNFLETLDFPLERGVGFQRSGFQVDKVRFQREQTGDFNGHWRTKVRDGTYEPDWCINGAFSCNELELLAAYPAGTGLVKVFEKSHEITRAILAGHTDQG